MTTEDFKARIASIMRGASPGDDESELYVMRNRINGKADIEADSRECVDVIASGYEWMCPGCDTYNKEIEACSRVTCKKCGKSFDTNPPEHCYE